MARPKSHHSRLMTRRIVFRITEGEFLRLAHKATALNMKVNAAARLLVMIMIERESPRSNGESRIDPALLKQLYHIGHNLNQLVKNAHIFGRVSPRIEKLCARIEALMDEAVGKEND